MKRDDDDGEKVRSVCDPLVRSIEEMIHRTYRQAYKEGFEDGASRQVLAFRGMLDGLGTESLSSVPAASGPPSPDVTPSRKPRRTTARAGEKGAAGARSVVYDIVREAHPQAVPSKTILHSLRNWDGMPKTARRDDLFYKAMRKLREDRKIVLTGEGYVLPVGSEKE